MDMVAVAESETLFVKSFKVRIKLVELVVSNSSFDHRHEIFPLINGCY